MIAAEDTRHTRNLLAHFQLDTPLTPYHQHSEPARTAALVDRMMRGESVALVTDAGTPGVSDPGSSLISAAIEAQIPVVPVPGASAVLTALVGSGVPFAKFAFEGFLPRDKSSMRERLASLALTEDRAMVFYEAGNRTEDTLKAMEKAFGPQRAAAVGRELTKKFESFTRGNLGDLASEFAKGSSRGEVTIVVGGREPRVANVPIQEPVSIEDALEAALGSGMTERDAVRSVAEAHKLGRRDVYAVMINRKKSG